MSTRPTPARNEEHRTSPELQPLAVSARQLAAMLDLSLRTIRTMDAAGKLPRGIRFGRSVRWSYEELRDWVAHGCPNRKTWNAIRANGKGPTP